MLRDYRLFESFAYHMVNLAQQKRIDKEFDLNGTLYAFDSTTIDLCLSLYGWDRFRSIYILGSKFVKDILAFYYEILPVGNTQNLYS